MTPVGPGCPHTEAVNRLSRDMYYAEDCVTVRLTRGEARMKAGETRMDGYDKTLERRETKQNIILTAVLSIAGMLAVHFIFHIG